MWWVVSGATVAGVVLGVTLGPALSRFVTSPAGRSELEARRDEPPPREHDVSPRALIESDREIERWMELVDRIPLGVVVARPDGEVVHRNRPARSMAGTHVGLLVDQALRDVMRQVEPGEAARRDVVSYGPPRLSLAVVARVLADGWIVATVEDQSERQRLDAVRTDFVANISHELKTPVGALAILAETLADEDDHTVVRRVAKRMVNESHRVARTIDDLMELSHIELGEQPRRDRVPAADIVRAAVERTTHLAEQRSIRLDVFDIPPAAVVIGDRGQLVSALGNLVENAVKYSNPSSDVQIRVVVHGSYVELMVADSGIGIPAVDHARIFERFYRVDKARSRDTGGTGLGLSIVRHVATNHRGEVLVSSREGEGSTFVLRLPLAGSTVGPLAQFDPSTAASERRDR